MSVVISELRLPADLDRIRTLHNANRPAPAPRRRFEWAYLENPDGIARAWGAEEDGTLVGVAVVFPRRVRLPDGTRVRAWTTGDLSVSSSHRRQGIASRLRGATRAAVDAGDCALLFAIPNPQAAGVHEKAGYWQLGRLERFVRLLSLPGPPLVRRAMRRVVQWWLPGCAAAPVDASWIERGDDPRLASLGALYESVSGGLRASVVRSEAYLRWRFLENPRTPARLLVTTRGGSTHAWGAVVDRGDSLYLRDWLARDDEAMRSLLTCLAGAADAEGKAWISAAVLEGHPHTAVLSGCGYRRRPEATDVKLYVPASTDWRAGVTHPQQWWLTAGDPDV